MCLAVSGLKRFERTPQICRILAVVACISVGPGPIFYLRGGQLRLGSAVTALRSIIHWLNQEYTQSRKSLSPKR